MRARSLQLCPTLCDLMDCIAHQAPLSMGFSSQQYWSGLPGPPPGHLPNPGIELVPLMSPALASRFFTSNANWKAFFQGRKVPFYSPDSNVEKFQLDTPLPTLGIVCIFD